ncbi:hypothetical protein RAD16_35765 [Bradyrhizobium sp. 18BD]
MDSSDMEVSCGMAQAFKFPMEADNGPPRGPLLWSLTQARRLVGSPLPTGPVEAGSLVSNMGLPPARRKREGLADAAHGGPDSRSPRSRPRLINPDRFDKNFRPECLERVDQEPDVKVTAAGYLRISTA